MKLRIMLPTEISVDEEVSKVIAEAQNGSFCILTRHRDFAAVLVPGIFSYETQDRKEVFLAPDEGVLVKRGDDVRVSTRNAVRGEYQGADIRTQSSLSSTPADVNYRRTPGYRIWIRSLEERSMM